MDLDWLADDPVDDVRRWSLMVQVDVDLIEDSSQAPLLGSLLPYVNHSQAQWEAEVSRVAAQIAACVQRRDWGATLIVWCQTLQALQSLKYRMPRELRAKLARLLYELAVMPKLDTFLTDLAASCCIRLLRPKHEIDQRDLQLPWRALYEALEREVFHKQRKVSTTTISGILLDLADACQRFFAQEEAPAMLEAILPRMDGNDLNSVIATQALLVHFLPLASSDAWLPVLFRLWDSFKSSLFDDQMLDLLARLAEEHVTRPTNASRWAETGIFTDEQMAVIMTRCLRSAGLPIGANKTANAALMAQSSSVRTGADATASQQTLRMKKPSDRLRSFATILVYSMAHDGDAPDLVGGSKALTQLAQFVQATETYFHPSNWGAWQAQLVSLVQHLTWEFAHRARAEKREDCRTPPAWRLTPLIQREFVRTLRTVSLLAMFSKDAVCSLAAQSSLKRMAFLEPALVLPAVLQRGFTSLEALETTQRTSAVMATLAATSQAFLSPTVYAPGPKHLAPLLYLCLPGIDMNDPMKTMSTCMLILSIAMSTCLADGSSAPANDEVPGGATTVVPLDDDTNTTRGAEDYAAQLSTAELDAWTMEFLQRVLQLFAALPEEGKSGKIGEKHEEMVLNLLIATCDVFCSALGEEALARCFDLVLEYARTTVAANGVKAVGSLIGCFARADPPRVLARVVPLACTRIAQELDHGASSVRTTSTSVPRASDTALHWHTSLLSSAIVFSGPALLTHADAVLATVGRLARDARTERGYVLGAKLLQRILHTLSSVYIAEQRSLNPTEWASEARRTYPHRCFGRLYALHDVQMTWHVPSEPEIDLALRVLREVVTPMLDLLDARLEETAHDDAWHNDVCRCLLWVRQALVGQAALADDARRGLPQPDTVWTDLGEVPAAAMPAPLDMSVGAALRPGDARYDEVQALRERIGTMLQRAAAVVPTLSGDHVDAIKQLVRALRLYLLPHTAHADEVQGLTKAVVFVRTISRRHARQQRFPRLVWLRRAMLHHVLRQRLQALYVPRTKRDDDLVHHLVDLATSHYVAVRRLAQSALDQVFATYDGTRYMCMQPLLAHLRDGASDEQVKGALHVLGTKTFQRTIARHVAWARVVLPGLLGVQRRARPSIQKLARGLLSELVARLEDPAMHLAYRPTQALDVAAAELRREEEPQLGLAPNETPAMDEAHAALCDELLAMLVHPQTHWAYAQLSVRALRALLRRDRPIPASLATHVARLAISENPEMRMHAQAALVRVLYFIKLQALSTGTDTLFECAHQPLKHTAPLGQVSARAAAYCAPLTPEAHLHDKGPEGWLVWPRTDTYYTVALSDACITDAALAAVAAEVCDPLWWDALVRQLSQEMERDYLAADTTTLLKSLSQMLGARLVPLLQPRIEELLAQRDRHKHRAAAEMVGGLVRGSKHWPLAAHEALQTWFVRVVPRAMLECTLDSQPAWQMCVEYLFHERDPRRLHGLLAHLWEQAQAVLDTEPSAASRSPGQQAHAQQLLASAVHALQSKALGWSAPVLTDTYIRLFAHDYQEVRKAVCEGLVELELAQSRPAMESVSALLEAAPARQGSLLRDDPAMEARVQWLQMQLRSWREVRQPSAQGVSAYDRAASTGALWVCLSLDDHRVGPMAAHVLTLVPDLLAAFQLRDNEELAETAHDVLVQLVSYPLSAAQVPRLLDALLEVLRHSPSWHARLDTLPLLQMVYFQNLFFLSSEARQQVLDVLMALLSDTHREVRDMAAMTLAGVVRCSQRAHVLPLSRTFAALAATPLPPRGTPRYDEALTAVHAGVLGAAALVSAFPYDVPAWMPALVLDTLAPHSESPAPVCHTVRQCAAEFRRTHQDTWVEDQLKFGERVQEVHDFTLGRSDYFV